MFWKFIMCIIFCVSAFLFLRHVINKNKYVRTTFIIIVVATVLMILFNIGSMLNSTQNNEENFIESNGTTLLLAVSQIGSLVLDVIVYVQSTSQPNIFLAKGLNFTKLVFDNPRYENPDTIITNVVLVDENLSMDKQYSIKLKKMNLLICMDKEVFDDDEYRKKVSGRKYKNLFLRNIVVTSKSVELEKTGSNDNKTEYLVEFKTEKNKLNDIIFNHNGYFYKDTNMIILQFKYKIVKNNMKIVFPKKTFSTMMKLTRNTDNPTNNIFVCKNF